MIPDSVGRLIFGFRKRVPLILQTEAAECSLACVAMVAAFHGCEIGLSGLRARHGVSAKGASIKSVIVIAQSLGLGTRALRLELSELSRLQLPCILHWNLNHFVVLISTSKNGITINDPSGGLRNLGFSEVSKSFSGVALELWPERTFVEVRSSQKIRIQDVVGRLDGASKLAVRILVISLGIEFFTLLSPLFLRTIVDEIGTGGDKSLVYTLTIGFLSIAALQQSSIAIRAWFITYVSSVVGIQWKSNIFGHLLKLPIDFFERRHLGDILSKVASADTIQRTLTVSFVEAVIDGIMAIITAVLLVLYSPKLGLTVIGLSLVYALIKQATHPFVHRATEQQLARAAKQQSQLLETIRGIKSISIFNRRDERRNIWIATASDQINASIQLEQSLTLVKLANGLLTNMGTICVVAAGALAAIDGEMSIGALVAFAAYKLQFDMRITALVDKLADFKMLRLEAERLADIVLTRPEAGLTYKSLKDSPEWQGEKPRSIVVKGLKFRYSEHEPYILNGVDFTINAGECVAIVGPSGAGKSTLLDILLGVLKPTSGEVSIGGISLWPSGVPAVRDLLGVVLQDDNLFSGSIAENISFFDVHPDNERIRQAAEQAAIRDEIEAMPMQYATYVGDMGGVLSGGQKQRVLIARALYKNPKILLFDEATSNLDVSRESDVNDVIKNLSITRVFIAHRPETIKMAGRIIRLTPNSNDQGFYSISE